MTISFERPLPIESGRNIMSKLSSNRTWCTVFQGIGCSGGLRSCSSASAAEVIHHHRKNLQMEVLIYVTATDSSLPAGNLVANFHSRQCQVSSFDGLARLGRDRFVNEQFGWGAIADTSPEGVIRILKSVGSLSEACCCSNLLDEDGIFWARERLCINSPRRWKNFARRSKKSRGACQWCVIRIRVNKISRRHQCVCLANLIWRSTSKSKCY